MANQFVTEVGRTHYIIGGKLFRRVKGVCYMPSRKSFAATVKEDGKWKNYYFRYVTANGAVAAYLEAVEFRRKHHGFVTAVQTLRRVFDDRVGVRSRKGEYLVSIPYSQGVVKFRLVDKALRFNRGIVREWISQNSVKEVRV